MATTWATILTEVRYTLQEDSPGDYWEDDELLVYGNRTCDAIALITGHRRVAFSFDVQADKSTYEWEGDIGVDDLKELLTDTLMYEGKHLDYITPADLPDGWQEDTGEPCAYLLNLNGIAGLTLYPTPSDDSEALAVGEAYTFDDDLGIVADIEGLDDTDFDTDLGGLVDVTAVTGGCSGTYIASKAAPMTDGSSNADIPFGYEDALRYGILWRAYEKDSEVQSPVMADRYRALFAAEMERLAATVQHDMQAAPDRPAVTYDY